MVTRGRRGWLLGMAGALLALLAACGGGSLEGAAEDAQPAGAIAPKSGAAFKGNGTWWNENEPGSGFFIEAQGATAVVTFFTYDSAGAARWYMASGELSATGDAGFRLSAPLLQYANGPTPFSSANPKPSSTAIGTVTLAFDGETAQVQVPGRSYTATKFNRAGRYKPATPEQPQTGIWWDPLKSGSGYTLEVADGQATIGLFYYDESGGGTRWSLVVVPLGEPPQPVTTRLTNYRGGQPFGGAYKAPTAVDGGPFGAQFGDRCRGLVSFVNGPGETDWALLRRFDFNGVKDCGGYAVTPSNLFKEHEVREQVATLAQQGYRPTGSVLYRRESGDPIAVEVADVDPNTVSFEARKAIYNELGQRGYRYVAKADAHRWGVFVKGPAGAVYSYRFLPGPTQVALTGDQLAAEANELGAQGFLPIAAGSVDERLYVKDSQSKARYVHEALPPPAHRAALEAQLHAQGLRGFRFRSMQGPSGAERMLYVKDATQSAVFSYGVRLYWSGYLQRLDIEAARGYLFLSRTYLTLGGIFAGYELFYRATNCTGVLCEVR
jgi:hypothetical protein